VINDQTNPYQFPFSDFYQISADSVSRANRFLSGVGILFDHVQSLEVFGGKKKNAFVVSATASGTTTTLHGGPDDDVFTVDDGNNSLDSLHGALSVDGGGGTNTLDFNDLGGDPSATPTHQYNYVLTQNSFNRGGTASTTFSGLTALSLHAANAPSGSFNSLDVESSAPGTTYQVYAGTGENLFYAFDLNYSLNGIQGPVFFHGAGGFIPNNDALFINDVDPTTRHTFRLNAGATPQSGVVERFNQAGTQADMAPISYEGLNAYDILYTAGSAGDMINVQGNAPDLSTIIATGASDTVNVDNGLHTLTGIEGDLRIQGSGAVIIDDSADISSRTIDLLSDPFSEYVLAGLLQPSFGLG